MSGQEITIAGPDGNFMGYLSRPSKKDVGAGVVVIQEIFGVNGFVRATADWFAQAGYWALAPDLFWRIEPGITLTDQSDAEWQKAFELYGKFNVDDGVRDIAAAISYLRAADKVSHKVGAVGYCLGGLLAYLTATRTDVDAAVGYYGVSIDKHLSEARQIRKPLMLHIAEQDEFVPREAQQKVSNTFAGRTGIVVHRYPGMNHAFARSGGKHFDHKATDLANARTLDFFAVHLA